MGCAGVHQGLWMSQRKETKEEMTTENEIRFENNGDWKMEKSG